MNLETLQNAVVICPNSLKKKLLAQIFQEKKILNIKFMSMQEYQKNWYFDYGMEAVRYLMDTEKATVEFANELLRNIYYVDENKSYQPGKLDDLARMKRELHTNGLLIENPIFKANITKQKVVVMGYGELDQFTQRMMDEVHATIIPFEEKLGAHYIIHTANDMENEVAFVYNRIADCLTQGQDINHIFVMNANEEYEPYFKRFNRYYGFSIEVNNRDTVLGTTTAKEFFSLVEDGTSTREEIYNHFANQLDNPVAQQITGLMNRYVGYEPSDVLDLMTYDLQRCSINNTQKNIVKRANLMDTFDSDDVVFLMAFNDKTPSMKRDTDYITDSLRPEVQLDSVEKTNERTKKNARAYLSTLHNLTISMCKHSPFTKFGETTLLDKEQWESEEINPELNYSEPYNRLRYSYLLDDVKKFGDTSAPELGEMYFSYDKNDYLTYDNQFTPLSSQSVATIGKAKLSYTSMEKFYECKFKYYMDKVLKLSQFEPNYAANIGTMCHDMLKAYCMDPKSFDFDKEWDSYLEENKKKPADKIVNTCEKDIFMTDMIKEEMRQTVEILKQQSTYSYLTHNKCESETEISLEPNIQFEGKIDKIMYQKDMSGKTVVNIVDYKTGKDDKPNMKYFPLGLNLQLPSYWYLIQNSKDLFPKEDVAFGGFYLQHILNLSQKADAKKTLEQLKEESMKLDGYSTADRSRLEFIDTSLEGGESKLLKSMKLTGKGDLYAYSKDRQLDDAYMSELEDLVKQKILEAGHDILAGQFKINPKMINGKDKACEYCDFKSICYVRPENRERIQLDGEPEEEGDDE